MCGLYLHIDLVQFDEETVNVVPGVVWVQHLLVLVDALYDESPQFLHLDEEFLMGSWEPIHHHWEEVIQLLK